MYGLEPLIHILKGISKELITVLVAASPFAELRVSIPLAIVMGLKLKRALILSVFGNLIPVMPLLFFLEPVSVKLRGVMGFAGFFDWFFGRIKNHTALVEKAEAFLIMLFVSTPLPWTGVWIACCLASLFKVRFRYALLSIAIGVVVAGLIVASMISNGKILV